MPNLPNQAGIVPEKRKFLKIAPAVLVTGIATSAGLARAASKEQHDKEPEVSPPEDLMREHGVLDRVLLIYEAGLRKFEAHEDFDPAVIFSAAQIVRDFIENYHEESEEHAVFPRFKQAGKLVTLVDTLVTQHKAGRRVTDVILKAAPRQPQGRRRPPSARRLDPGLHRHVPAACGARGYGSVPIAPRTRLRPRI